MQGRKSNSDFASPTRGQLRPQVDFVRIELDTSTLFARLALRAQKHEARERHWKNARKGYDIVRRFLPSLRLTPEEVSEFSHKIDELQAALFALGDKPEELELSDVPPPRF